MKSCSIKFLFSIMMILLLSACDRQDECDSGTIDGCRCDNDQMGIRVCEDGVMSECECEQTESIDNCTTWLVEIEDLLAITGYMPPTDVGECNDGRIVAFDISTAYYAFNRGARQSLNVKIFKEDEISWQETYSTWYGLDEEIFTSVFGFVDDICCNELK